MSNFHNFLMFPETYIAYNRIIIHTKKKTESQNRRIILPASIHVVACKYYVDGLMY